MKKLNKNGGIIFGIVTIVALTFSLFLYISKINDRKQIEENWYYTTATIQSITKTKENEKKGKVTIDYTWKLSYVYKNMHYTSSLCEKESKFDEENRKALVGDIVGVFVNPKNPNEVYMESFYIQKTTNNHWLILKENIFYEWTKNMARYEIV